MEEGEEPEEVDGIPAEEEAKLPETVAPQSSLDEIFQYEDEGVDDLQETDLVFMEEGTTTGGGGAGGGGMAPVNLEKIELQLAQLNDNMAKLTATFQLYVDLKMAKLRK